MNIEPKKSLEQKSAQISHKWLNNAYLCEICADFCSNDCLGIKRLRHGVVARTAPGVATQDATNGQIETFKGAMLLYGLFCVLLTSRGETTGWRSERTDAPLIENDGDEQQPLQDQ